MLTYHTPETATELVTLRAEHGSASLLMGGGTIVMTLLNEGVPLPRIVIGMKRAGLDTISEDDGSKLIGAATTLATLTSDPHPMLSEAAASCGGWAIRNMATIGGNLFVPAPSGDLGVALLALDASLRIDSVDGHRLVPIDDFYRGGRSLDEREVLTGIEVPTTEKETRFIKFGRKHGPTPSVVTVAISLRLENGTVSESRIALGALGPHPVRARRAESLLDGNELDPALVEEVAAAAADDFEGLTDAVASAWYRKRMARLHVKRLLEEVMSETHSG
ncbi:MAG TPA: FAD binding domain-containing protein [Acidimicrobiia bacterium]